MEIEGEIYLQSVMLSIPTINLLKAIAIQRRRKVVKSGGTN